MKPIETIEHHRARELTGLAFDLDDTLLDDGRLSEAAYCAMHRLADAGLTLIAVTGRPSSWGAVLARQWPVLGVVTENGAIVARRAGRGLQVIDSVPTEVREARRRRLRDLTAKLRTELPDLVPSDDVAGRVTDFTFDIGEHRAVSSERVRQARAMVEAEGARTLVSSVHLHVTFDKADKASGTVRFASRALGTDPTSILQRFAYIGDSENDETCFAAFRVTIGVQNLSGRPTVPPRYITQSRAGAGFVEAATTLIARRDARD